MDIHISQQAFELYVIALGTITLVFGTLVLLRVLRDSRDDRKAREVSALAEAIGFATLGRQRRWIKGPDADQSHYETMH